MSGISFVKKLRAFIWWRVVTYSRSKSYYPKIYKCYWHTLYATSKIKEPETQYFSAIPNPGAGIGHQMGNWIAGFWFAKQFNLKFAHIPFANARWETFLGFGQDEITLNELLK